MQFSGTCSDADAVQLNLKTPPLIKKRLNPKIGRVPVFPKTAPSPTPQVERLLWWSWSRFRKYLAKQLHLLD